MHITFSTHLIVLACLLQSTCCLRFSKKSLFGGPSDEIKSFVSVNIVWWFPEESFSTCWDRSNTLNCFQNNLNICLYLSVLIFHFFSLSVLSINLGAHVSHLLASRRITYCVWVYEIVNLIHCLFVKLLSFRFVLLNVTKYKNNLILLLKIKPRTYLVKFMCVAR